MTIDFNTQPYNDDYDENKKFYRILYKPSYAVQARELTQMQSILQNQINHLLPSITNIDMYGGEPFLIKRFSEILKSAVDRDLAKHIRLHYNSNGSVWPSELINYWPNFKLVDINFSIDAIGDQFNLQRGGSWNDVESNILKIKNLGFNITKSSAYEKYLTLMKKRRNIWNNI